MRKCDMCGQCLGHVECTRGDPNQCNDCSLPNPPQQVRQEESGIESRIPPTEPPQKETEKEEVVITHPGPQRANTAEISEKALPSRLSCAIPRSTERANKGKNRRGQLPIASSEDSLFSSGDKVNCSCAICRARKGSNCSDSTSDTEDYQTTAADNNYSGKSAQSAKEENQLSQPRLKSKPLVQNCFPTSTSMQVTSALYSAVPDSVSSTVSIHPELHSATPSPPLSPSHSCSLSPCMLTPLSTDANEQSPLLLSLPYHPASTGQKMPYLSPDSGTKSDSRSHVLASSSTQQEATSNKRKSPYPRRLRNITHQPQESVSVFKPSSTHSNSNSKEIQRKRTSTPSSEIPPAAKKPKRSSSQESTSVSQNNSICRRIFPIANLVRSPLKRKAPSSPSSSSDSEEANHSSPPSMGALNHLVHRDLLASSCETEHIVPTCSSAHNQTETHIPPSTEGGSTAQSAKKNTKKKFVILVTKRVGSTTQWSQKVVDVKHARWLSPQLTRTLPYKETKGAGLGKNMQTPKNDASFLSPLVHQAKS